MFTKEECQAFAKVVEEHNEIKDAIGKMNDMLFDINGILEMAELVEPPLINAEQGKQLANVLHITRAATYMLNEIMHFTYV